MKVFKNVIYELKVDKEVGRVHEPIYVYSIWFDEDDDLMFLAQILCELKKMGCELSVGKGKRAIKVDEESIMEEGFPVVSLIARDPIKFEKFIEKFLKGGLNE